ncbi:transposase [Teichococcus vastitatis]|uniref:Transposase n=1 Tax=Teichococcus vastitatis TaxID=2307076 RepID=A0ABS9W5S8_9PROT|nr:transposase [Pseudoroseomonas vastitatis]MCI0754556.1 transposase [Pseudoroseomonas vastitatis]
MPIVSRRATLLPMRAPPLPHAARLSPPRPWAPLSDAEWHALLPYLLPRSPQGRPIRELRARMDAIFHTACSHAPWADLPDRFGKPDTVSRYFRRLTHAGLWQRLLLALAEAAPAHPLRAIEHWICRAARRAHRILGLPLILLVRRIGLRSALPAPPWLLPDPLLSETLAALPVPAAPPRGRGGKAWHRALLGSMKRLLRDAGGRARIPRSVRLGWP